MRYSSTERRNYIAQHRDTYQWWVKKTEGGYSFRDIAYDIQRVFKLDKAPSPETIRSDIRLIDEGVSTSRTLTDEAARLLERDNFPEWRSLAFSTPSGGTYETPLHQLAWFYLFSSVALKEPLPKWVLQYYNDNDPAFADLHLNEWMANPDQLLSLFLLAPPRHGKSDLLGHACMWLICRNPNIRIIWCGGGLKISTLTSVWVRDELESNEWLIQHYGPFHNDNNWGKESWTVVNRDRRQRSNTFTAVGKNSTILSLDADIIIVDDYVDEKDSRNAPVIAGDARWLKTALFTRREPHTPLLGIGSHQPSPVGDAYSLLEEDEENPILFVKMRAHDYTKCKPREGEMTEEDRHGEWCILWSSLRPLWFLESMRQSLGDVLFEVCYNQDERKGRVEYFPESIIRGEFPRLIDGPDPRVTPLPNLAEVPPGVLDLSRTYGQSGACCRGRETKYRVMGFDPAAGETKDASEAVLLVLEVCWKCGRRYVLDLWHERKSPETHPDTILSFVEVYRPARVRVEKNAYQKALARDRNLTQAQARLRFQIDEWTTGEKKWDPVLGVPSLNRYMRAGIFSLPGLTPDDRRKSDWLQRQLIRWPMEPNDGVMGLWFADMSAVALLDERNYNLPDSYLPEEDVPQYLLDEFVSVDLYEMVDQEYLETLSVGGIR